jgi:hypothetical protein
MRPLIRDEHSSESVLQGASQLEMACEPWTPLLNFLGPATDGDHHELQQPLGHEDSTTPQLYAAHAASPARGSIASPHGAALAPSTTVEAASRADGTKRSLSDLSAALVKSYPRESALPSELPPLSSLVPNLGALLPLPPQSAGTHAAAASETEAALQALFANESNVTAPSITPIEAFHAQLSRSLTATVNSLGDISLTLSSHAAEHALPAPPDDNPAVDVSAGTSCHRNASCCLRAVGCLNSSRRDAHSYADAVSAVSL